MNIKAPQSFEDILKLQEILDNEIHKARDNGFIPGERTIEKIILSLDDEINEFAKELPLELNFKTWKEKEHAPKKQLEEYVDILFFLAEWINNKKHDLNYLSRHSFEGVLDDWLVLEKNKHNKYVFEIGDILQLKEYLLGESLEDVNYCYVLMATSLNYTTKKIYAQYWKKWQENMKRIDKDWSLKEK